jgi:hypothetical protein
MSDNFFQLFSSVIDASNLSDEDKRFVKAGTWTLEETPEITTVEQYAQYERIIAEVSSKYDKATQVSLAFFRSPDGMLITALGGRMIEWEEEHADDR